MTTDPNVDIAATLTRHMDGMAPEYIPVDHRLAVIPVKVNGIKMAGLIDSGSSLTLASEAIADIAKVKVSEGDKVIRAITGHTEPVSMKGIVKLDIAGYKETVEVNFMGDNQMGIKNPYDIVIGQRYLTAFPANDDGHEKEDAEHGE